MVRSPHLHICPLRLSIVARAADYALLIRSALASPVESKIVFHHGVWSDGYLAWIGQIESVEDDLVTPDLAQEVFEDLKGQLFSGAPIREPALDTTVST